MALALLRVGAGSLPSQVLIISLCALSLSYRSVFFSPGWRSRPARSACAPVWCFSFRCTVVLSASLPLFRACLASVFCLLGRAARCPGTRPSPSGCLQRRAALPSGARSRWSVISRALPSCLSSPSPYLPPLFVFPLLLPPSPVVFSLSWLGRVSSASGLSVSMADVHSVFGGLVPLVACCGPVGF